MWPSLRANDIAEEDAERIALKLTPSEVSILNDQHPYAVSFGFGPVPQFAVIVAVGIRRSVEPSAARLRDAIDALRQDVRRISKELRAQQRVQADRSQLTRVFSQ